MKAFRQPKRYLLIVYKTTAMQKRNLLFFLCTFLLSLSAIAQNNLSQIQTLLNQSAKNYDLKADDVQNWIITSEHYSKRSGIHHVYLRQAYQGIEVRTATAALHIDRGGKVVSMSNNFLKNLPEKIINNTPTLSAEDALRNASQQMNYEATPNINVVSPVGGVNQAGILEAASISKREISVKLMYEVLEDGSVTLVWNMPIYELNGLNWWDMRIDASTGAILSKDNWIVSCDFDDPNHQHAHHNRSHCNNKTTPNSLDFSALGMVGAYNVYAMPVESPNFGDRSIVTDPEDPVASPFGWHDTNGAAGAEYTITRGNNCHAYEDGDNAGFSPDGGEALNFDFPFNTTYSSGDQSEAGALTNLFYWTNLCHDVWYQYGFDEASGNFQENNYGNGGTGGDSVNSEAQDGSGTCNANFGTPPEGGNPTMQMYVCGARDGDVDNAVIVHEYGHGISIRLTGGAGNSGCLSNSEQMGEGWSDWFSLMMTLEEADMGEDSRGMGTWLIGEGPNGGGIRPHPYSTDMNINPHTYDDIKSLPIPHGVGAVWCMMLWEMAWALIDEHGFDPDFYYGTGGNNMAMALVTEGLKLQPCSPGFVDGRDAILAADQALYGGVNSCLIWEAFAKRGLGFGAKQGSTGSAGDGTEAFDMPPSCTIALTKTADVETAEPGETITYTITASNQSGMPLTNVVISDEVPALTTYADGSASDGGSENGGVVSFPAVDLANEESITRSFSVTVNLDAPISTPITLDDDMENGGDNWTAVTANNLSNWTLTGTNPNSGTTSWFAADVSSPEEQYLTIANAFLINATSSLEFYHSYDTENNWDGGVVEISTNGGTSWSDLGVHMTQNGYNGVIDNSSSSPAFSGNSGGYVQTIVDLSAFEGQSALIRFRMHCDQSVGGNGWYIDDVHIGNIVNLVQIPNIAEVTTNEGLSSRGALMPATRVTGEIIPIIQFPTTNITFEEEESVNHNLVGNCRTYTDHNIDVSINEAPDTPAEVAINVVPSLASNMEDFELITTQLTLSEAGNFPITFRLYDDGAIENNEIVTLEMTLMNAENTDAILGSQNTVDINLNDNDHPPTGEPILATIVNTDLEIDAGGLTSTNPNGGDNWALGSSEDATSTYWNVPSNGSSTIFYVNDDACDCEMSDVKLRSPILDLSTSVEATFSFDIFYENRTYSSTTETAFVEISLDGGSTFSVITELEGQDVWRTETIDLGAFAGNNNVQVALRYNDGGSWLYGMALDNLNITQQNPGDITIATQLNDIDEQYVGANSDVFFYANDGSLLARIQNGSHNFGCVELEVDRAGTGATDFQNNQPANRLADKTFKFTPEFNDPNAFYQVTLYYSQEEVTGWESVTGLSWNETVIVKSPGSITNVTPANPTPDGAIITSTPTSLGQPPFATNDYYISAAFNNGFSGMGVGNPEAAALGVDLLNFNGKHVTSKGNQLSWATLTETSNDFFVLERSFDGKNFDFVAQIDGAGNSSERIQYEFLDKKYQIGDNYYRLIQQDINGKQTISEIILITVNEATAEVQVFPNPTKELVNIHFQNLPAEEVELELFDALGKLLRKQTVIGNNGQVQLDLKDLTEGVYYLNLTVDGLAVQKKIVKM